MLGSCLALNLSYFGCCVSSLSPTCSNNGCYCDQNCHIMNNCCNDIADIGCYTPYSFSSTVLPTQSNKLGKTKSEANSIHFSIVFMQITLSLYCFMNILPVVYC